MDREDYSIAYRGGKHSLAQCTEATCIIHFYPGGDPSSAPASPALSASASASATDSLPDDPPAREQSPADSNADVPMLSLSDFDDGPANAARTPSPTISEVVRRPPSPTVTELAGPAPTRDPRYDPTPAAAAFYAWRAELGHARWDRYFESKTQLQVEELGEELVERRLKYAQKDLKRTVAPRKSRRQRQGRRDDLSEWGAMRVDALIHSGFIFYNILPRGGPRPMVDSDGYVIGLLSRGPLDRPDWPRVHGRAFGDLRRFLRNGVFLANGESRSRWGLTAGFPHERPENIPLEGVAAQEIARILQSPHFKTIAAYQTHLVQQFFPNCYTISSRAIAELLRLCPDLSVPFPGSPFTTGEINFGDVPKLSFKNLGNTFYIVEAMTVLGKFDDLLGGELISPDDDSATRFGPGMTAILPTGSKEFMLAAVGKDETRYLFRQYFCARVLRWVEKGGRTDDEFDKTATDEECEAWEEKRLGRTDGSINAFSKLRDINLLG
ncbi:hypothetical protein R3P38DRAFT_2767052 [Favolaschia claudopus]|uniref:Uncharacterized protein n=1 Tax=Favolaschia claudopus TaxID=2862362 RepID=A0AAW0CYU7_9AGAR